MFNISKHIKMNLVALFFVIIPHVLSLRKTIPGKREELGNILQREGENFKIGVEVGVEYGRFSKEILSRWHNCQKYYLVDVWKHLEENYIDGTNASNDIQERKLQETLKNVEPFKSKVEVVRKYSKDAAEAFAKQNIKFDAVYIDARHDYCSVKEDIELYYPLLKEGGIFSGHDYGIEVSPVCPNGTVIRGGVQRAVDEFCKAHNLEVEILETTWIIRKPHH